MASTAPGQFHREGLSIIEQMDVFRTAEAATEWFESVIWPDGLRHCSKCGSAATRPVPNAKPMAYRCLDCRRYFNLRTGTLVARSKIPLGKRAVAVCLCLASQQPLSSVKPDRDLRVSQPAAWSMLRRIREAWAVQPRPFDGPVGS